MANYKIDYEWCWEEIETEYGDIVDLHHADLKDGHSVINYGVNKGNKFDLALKKWYSNEWDADCEYNYVSSDGSFEQPVPKYVLKIFNKFKDDLINHPDFRGDVDFQRS
mgnify:CR=1 FL=1